MPKQVKKNTTTATRKPAVKKAVPKKVTAKVKKPVAKKSSSSKQPLIIVINK